MKIQTRANASLMAHSDRQFAEEGTTPWLQTLDEAEAISRDVLSATATALKRRIDALQELIASLAWRGDDLLTLVDLRPLRGAALSVTLSNAPALLRRLVDSRA